MRGQAALALREMDLRDAPCSYARELPLGVQRADIAQRGGVASEALRVDILLPSGFSLAEFGIVMEALAVAGSTERCPRILKRVISESAGSVASSCGVSVSTISVESIGLEFGNQPDIVIIPGDTEDRPAYQDKRLINYLRAANRQGAQLCLIGASTFLAARAGLLDNRCCAVHWRILPAFREFFPKVRAEARFLCADKRIVSSLAGTCALAAINKVLLACREEPGQVMERELAGRFSVDSLHTSDQIPLASYVVGHPRGRQVNDAIQIMHETVESPVQLDDLARRVGTSRRQMERLFRSYLGKPPQKVYREIRLQTAYSLLMSGNMSVTEVAYAAGFVSPSHFGHSFVNEFGFSPNSIRRSRSHGDYARS